MTNASTSDPASLLVEAVEIPESAYERAESRYEDLGNWLCRPESTCRGYDPASSRRAPSCSAPSSGPWAGRRSTTSTSPASSGVG